MERRKMQRFPLELPTVLSCVTPDEDKTTLKLTTRNISAGGALFPPRPAVPLSSRVEVDLFLPPKNAYGASSPGAHVRLSGTVIRNDDMGMAVRFSNRFRISRMLH
jgi:c-di-GMP-binding flagellar brake protein YcgR